MRRFLLPAAALMGLAVLMPSHAAPAAGVRQVAYADLELVYPGGTEVDISITAQKVDVNEQLHLFITSCPPEKPDAYYTPCDYDFAEVELEPGSIVFSATGVRLATKLGNQPLVVDWTLRGAPSPSSGASINQGGLQVTTEHQAATAVVRVGPDFECADDRASTNSGFGVTGVPTSVSLSPPPPPPGPLDVAGATCAPARARS